MDNQLQIKIDELDDWLRSNKGHHRYQEIQYKKKGLELRLNGEINQIEVIDETIL